MSVKVKQAIVRCLDKIENAFFDEDTIRTLLIVSREHIKTDGLIRELAHFVAHNERTQGIFHRKVNSRYTKLKIVKERGQSVNLKELAKTIKTEEQLSDFMLGGIDIEKVEGRLFNILFIDGLDDLPEEHVKKYTGLTRKEVQDMITRFYHRKDGFYYLKTNTTKNLVNAFKMLPTELYDPNGEPELAKQIADAENIANNIKTKIDNVLKVIRGAIFFNSVFDAKTFRDDIQITIANIVKKFELDYKYLKAVEDSSDEILLCIMTLLHDSRFLFYDKNEARTFLCLYRGDNFEESQRKGYDIQKDMYENGVLALYLEGSDMMTIPLFVSDLKIKQYLSFEDYAVEPASEAISESIWVTASRFGSNGPLHLVR